MCGVWLSLPILFLPSSRIRSRFLPLISVVFFPILVFSMGDCSCRCLAKMARIAEGRVHESGLELTQTQRRGQISCLLYNNHRFRTPYVCRLTVGDLKESWVCVSIHFIFYFFVGLYLNTTDWIWSLVLWIVCLYFFTWFCQNLTVGISVCIFSLLNSISSIFV